MARPRPATPLADELDAPDLGAGRPASGSSPTFTPIPDIAPPLLLEPMPAPTLLVVETPEPEPFPADDPYAWASQAASELERAGRSFDDMHAPLGLVVPPPPPKTPEPPARPEARIRFNTPEPPRAPTNPPRAIPEPPPAPMNPARAAPPPTPRVGTNPPGVPTPPTRMPTNPPRAATPPPTVPTNPPGKSAAKPAGTVPAARSGSATGVRLLVGAGGLMLAGIAAVLVVVATGLAEPPEPPLRPVDGADAPPPRFALPSAPVTRPPGSDAAALGAVTGAAAVPQEVRLELVTRPAGARVMLNGQSVGTSPVTIPTQPGTHALRVELAGFPPIERVVQLKGPPIKLELDFEGALASGPVRVIATGWEGARLRIDGRHVGVVPTTIDLAQGEHTFELELNGRRTELRRAAAPLRGQEAVLDLGLPATSR